MIVVDASVLVDYLLGSGGHSALDHWLVDHVACAPHLIDIEVMHVIRRHVTGGAVSEPRGRQATQDLATFPLTRVAHLNLLPRIWTLRANLTAYDATYVALAEILDAPLLTRDRKLGAAFGHAVQIVLI